MSSDILAEQVDDTPVSKGKNQVSKLVKFYWYKYHSVKWKPKIREGASLFMMGKYAYMYGGRAGGIMKDLSRLDP